MPVIDYIDGANRDIYLSADTVGAEVNPIDIYKEMRVLRKNDEALRKFRVFLTAKGNESKGGGTFTERYVICMEGTRIIPYDVTHQVTITGTIITDDGQSGIACFDRTPLTATTVVDIAYVPPQVEVIVVQGGSGLDVDQDLKLTEIHSGVNRMVHVDCSLLAYGDGSPTAPFNTIAAAVGYANTKGIHSLHIHSDCTLDADIENFEVHGLTQPNINLGGRSVESTDFHNCQISGSSTSIMGATYRHCNIMNGASGLNGIYHQCALSGDVTMLSGGYLILSSCFSGIAGSSRPSIDMQSSGSAQLAFRVWSGGIEIRNMVAGDALTVELDAGECRFAANCTGGDAHVRGVGYMENLGSIVPVTRSLVAGGGSLSSEQDTKLDELHKIMGLDSGNPATATPTSRTAGAITQTISGDGNTTSTITRI